jgi:hypothetical protein
LSVDKTQGVSVNLFNRLLKRLPSTVLVGFAAACTLATPALAGPVIDKQLVVKVITLCDTGGGNCASNGPAGDLYYEKKADKIWAQAGIDIKFVDGGKLNNTFKNSSAAGVADFTGALSGPGTTMYLVSDLACSGCSLYGEAWIDAGGLVINMGDVDAYNGGIGRLDTIAHELGHNLNLLHDDSNSNYLIHSGTGRNIPSSLGQICPDGPCYDLLSDAQIATARRSSLLIAFDGGNQVPEPSGLALAGLALLGAGVARRRSA